MVAPCEAADPAALAEANSSTMSSICRQAHPVHHQWLAGTSEPNLKLHTSVLGMLGMEQLMPALVPMTTSHHHAQQWLPATSTTADLQPCHVPSSQQPDQHLGLPPVS